MNRPLKHPAALRDPRMERLREHLLEEILLIALAAIPSRLGVLELKKLIPVQLTGGLIAEQLSL